MIMKNNTKKIILLLILVLAMLGIFVAANKDKSGAQHKKNEVTAKLDDVKSKWQQDVEDAKNGKYKNLNIVSIKSNIDDIEQLFEINLMINKEYEERTNKENIENIDQIINNYFDRSFDRSVVVVNYFDKNGNYEQMPYEQFKNEMEDLDIDKYFLLFGDARENGGKGFLQIDSSTLQIWFSKGEIPSTLPMYSYDTKKVYNLTINKDGLTDIVKLENGDISIEESIHFVENYLNHNLPYEKNKEFIYEAAEVRVLNVDGQDALGFCVRKKYNNIPFDYIDGTTEGIYNSDYWDDRGELCMIKKDDIDNICGLGGDTYFVEKSSDNIKEILSLSDALEAVSDKIGENSIYDVYGVEMIYQFTENKDLECYNGRLVWKIITRNQNDDKDTWFYVDIETGVVNYRYKQIYGEDL